MQTDDSSRKLSPIGEIQAAAVKWTRENGNPGTMLTPVGLMLDVFSGWTVPRHLYVPQVYQTWGGIPYNDGDHLTHGIFSLLYPGYEDAGYFRDERGFMSPTPFGDIADTMLTDAPTFLLNQYAVIVCAGAISPTDELRDNLAEYVENGGHLVITQANAALLMCDVTWRHPQTVAAGKIEVASVDSINEPVDFDVISPIDLTLWTITVHSSGTPVVIQRPSGKGKITVLLSSYGIAQSNPKTTCPNETETPLPALRPLLAHVRHALSAIFSEYQLVSTHPDLTTILCRHEDSNRYTLGLFNNTLTPKPMQFESRIGTVLNRIEQVVPPADVQARGYLPNAQQITPSPESIGPAMIAAGDVRIFSLEIDDALYVSPQPVADPPARPRNRFISLRGHHSITETLLKWPTFFQHLDGIKIDWTYLRGRDGKAVAFEAEWIRRQSLRVLVDFSSGLNFYPGLTLLDTFTPRYEESIAAIEDVLRKAAIIGAEGILFSLHRMPENHCDKERAAAGFVRCAKRMTKLTRDHLGPNARCYVSHHPTKWLTTLADVQPFVEAVDDGLEIAWQLGHETVERFASLSVPAEPVGIILAASGVTDAIGQWYDAHAPASRLPINDWRPLTALGVPIVLDSTYPTWDDAYGDIRAIFGRSSHPVV